MTFSPKQRAAILALEPAEQFESAVALARAAREARSLALAARSSRHVRAGAARVEHERRARWHELRLRLLADLLLESGSPSVNCASLPA